MDVEPGPGRGHTPDAPVTAKAPTRYPESPMERSALSEAGSSLERFPRHQSVPLPVVRSMQAESPKKRGNAERLMNRIAQLSRDMFESLRTKIACGPRAALAKRSLRKKRMATSLEIHRHVSDVQVCCRDPFKDRNMRSLDLPRSPRIWRNVHGSVKEWQENCRRRTFDYCFDDLVVDGVVGKGAHGTVHKGRVANQLVAVKVGIEDEKGQKCRMPPELELMCGVCHPHLVQIYGVHMVDKAWGWELNDSGSECESSLDSYSFSDGARCHPDGSQAREDNLQLYQTVVVMEYCDKGNLWEAVKNGEFCVGGNRSAPDYKRILEVALEISFAMKHLHERGIIHGDLTAKNVLLSSACHKEFIAKVGDFGLCRRPECSRQDLTTFSLGSVDHMAPETLRDGKVHNPTDVFSFGILLYEMITGRHPFQTMVPAAILVAIVEGARPKIPRNCPQDLASLIQECWHQDWRYRPSFNIILGRLINYMA